MDNVVFEAPEYMQNGVGCPDVAQELVAKTLLLAPLTSPAMSTISTVVGITFCGWTSSASLFSLGSEL